MKKFIATLCFAVTAFTLFGSTPLFDAGKSSWKIVISPRSSTTEQRAAEELQTFLYKISGAKLYIDKSGKIPSANALVIGTRKNFPALPAAVTDFSEGDEGKDSIRIKSLNGNLYFTGNVPRGALYAVYTFLKKSLGVRWFFAGEQGELVPRRAKFVLPELDIYEVAKFKLRAFHVCGKHYDRDMETWMSRNRINFMSSDPIGKHTWRRAWNDGRIAKGFQMHFDTHNVAIYDKKVFAAHPELFAEIDGKRIPDQLCWSNPEVDKILIDRFISYCKEYPKVESLGLSAADNMNYCRCVKCRKKSLHDLWFELYNRIRVGVQKELPHIKFGTIAYQSYSKVPQTSMAGSMHIMYCMYDRCYVHRHGQCKMNDRAMQNIKAWQKKKLPVIVYGYEFDIFSPDAPAPFYYMISDELRHFYKNGIAGVFTECTPINWRRNGTAKDSIPAANNHKLAFYLYASALWDPAVDPNAVIREYSEAAYGAAAAPFMAEYAMLMGKAWDSMKIHYSYFYNSPVAGSASLLSPELIAKIDALMLKAAAAVKTEKDAARRKQICANFDEELRIYSQLKASRNSYIASQSNLNVLVPRAKAPLDFSRSTKITNMTARARAGKHQAWSVKVNYDAKAIYFDIDCKEKDMKNLVALHSKRDSEVFNDKCIELFISVPNDTRGIYRHLVANTAGAKYDAIALGGFTFDTSWNPDWQVNVTKNSDGWRMKLVIPFSALDTVAPKPGDVWPFTIKRSDKVHSGFPDAVYHDQNAFAMLQFVEEAIPTGLYAFNSKMEDINVMRTMMEKAGFQTVTGNTVKTAAARAMDREVYVFRLAKCDAATADFFSKKVYPALKNGALVICFGYGSGFAPDKFFNDPALKLKWSGWRIDKSRKSYDVLPGKWQTDPCDLRPALFRTLTPASGWYPQNPAAWKNHGKVKIVDGTFASFLLSTKVGKGTLVVSSTDFGFSGGHVMFGNKNKDQAVMLLRNLYQMHRQ